MVVGCLLGLTSYVISNWKSDPALPVLEKETVRLNLSYDEKVKRVCHRNLKFWKNTSHINEQWNSIQHSSDKYVDHDFKADRSSLYLDGYTKRSRVTDYFSRVHTWKRPSDFEKAPSLWGSKGVLPAGVV